MSSLFSYWSFDDLTTAFIILLCIAYLYTIQFRPRKQSIYFFSGIFLLIICVASPLSFLGENYMFSAHMLSSVLILLIASPLLVAGIPKENKFRGSFRSLSEKISKAPLACWLTGEGVMWFWHIPYIFNQMSMNSSHSTSAASYLHLLSLLVSGMIFCLPIINPYREFRIAPLSGVLYLASACAACSLLGLLITFAPMGIFTPYLNMNDAYDFLPMIRNDWNISAATDQQMGGLIMWVPCCFVYLSASMYLLITWFDERNQSPVTHQIIQ